MLSSTPNAKFHSDADEELPSHYTTDLSLGDYIRRYEEDCSAKREAEEREKTSLRELRDARTRAMLAEDRKEILHDLHDPITNFINKETNMNRECKVNTKDVVIIEEGKASKFDTNKPRMDLLPAVPLKEIAEILTYGADKYGADNWRSGEPIAFSRHYAGVQRHLFAWQSGETLDPETGKNHLAHAMCGLLFLLELSKTHPEKDDRYFEGSKWTNT